VLGGESGRWKISTTPKVGLQLAKHQQEGSGIGRRRLGVKLIERFVARSRVRRHEHPFAGRKGLIQQPRMLRLHLLVLAELRLLDVDLILEGELPLGIQRPDGPAHRRQRGDDARQELAIELLRRHLGFRQAGNFRHQRADLLLRLFDELGIERLFNTHDERGKVRRAHPICYVLAFRSLLKGSSGESRLRRMGGGEIGIAQPAQTAHSLPIFPISVGCVSSTYLCSP
jgi:hypothetical protein